MPFKFKRNMGTTDRIIRTLVGLTLLTIGPVTGLLTTDALSQVLMGIVGFLAIFSAITSYCMLYDVTGFDTNSNHKR